MTDRPITYRPAHVGDAHGIVDVFRSAMPPGIVAVNVLGMPRSVAFVGRAIEASEKDGSDRFWVADEAGVGIVGFAQLRRGIRRAFINNVQVLPSRQSAGIGGRLLRLLTADVQAAEVGVDVFSGSEVSRALFERAGFAPVATYHWHIVEPSTDAATPYVVHDLAQADLVHATLDVSTVRVETRKAIHPVGRLGPGLFRLTTSSAFEDEGLRPALAALDPTRSNLLIVVDRYDPVGRPPALVSYRMHASRDALTRKYGP